VKKATGGDEVNHVINAIFMILVIAIRGDLRKMLPAAQKPFFFACEPFFISYAKLAKGFVR
jgi:hypothetical protein